MKNASICFAFLFLLNISTSFSQKSSGEEKVDLSIISRIKEEGFDRSKVMETLFNLTDVSGPRLSGSTNLKNAQDWAIKQLTDWGLSNAKSEPWGAFGKGWETEKCYVAMTAPYYQALIATPKAWTQSTDGLIKGNVVLIRADSAADLAKYKGKLKGKIVILAPYTDIKMDFKPDARRHTDEDLRNLSLDPSVTEASPSRPAANDANQMRVTRAWRQKVSAFLAEESVAAILGGRGGSMGTLFTTNGASYAMNATPAIAELEMGTEHLNRMIRLIEAGKIVEVELEIKNKFLTNDSVQYNVIAEIPGTDKNLKPEIVMIGAHLDSWQAGTGATDNAAGCAVMMEAMRILKTLDIQPRRTIRIALWSAEEQGLLGSRGYVKNHFADRETMELKPEHSKLSAYFNLDNGGGKIRGIYLQKNDALRPVFETWFEPFKDMGATTVTSRTTGSTDHIPFDAVGLPGFQFIQDPMDYGTRTHHTNMDLYDRIQKNDLAQASVIIASFVYNAAMRDQMLTRKALPKVEKKK